MIDIYVKRPVQSQMFKSMSLQRLDWISLDKPTISRNSTILPFFSGWRKKYSNEICFLWRNQILQGDAGDLARWKGEKEEKWFVGSRRDQLHPFYWTSRGLTWDPSSIPSSCINLFLDLKSGHFCKSFRNIYCGCVGLHDFLQNHDFFSLIIFFHSVSFLGLRTCAKLLLLCHRSNYIDLVQSTTFRLSVK